MSDHSVSTIFKVSGDIYEFLQIFPNPDGTVTRKPNNLFPPITAIADPDHPTPVLSKDIPINQSKNTWARIYLPRKAIEDSPLTNKLPLVVYFHGGGFILFSAASSIFHPLCSYMALQLPAIVVSIEYRLAPEHRLPAAYDDAVEALYWVKLSNEVWLRDYVDYSSCFVMGGSAGGNMAYHVGLRTAETARDLEPLKIKGLILHQPFFGGTQRTESELKMENDPVLPSRLTDLFWEWSLPIGVDRDHEYSNPTVGGGSKFLDHFKMMGWKVLVTGLSGDPLIDRQIEFVKLLEKRGVTVEGHFDEGSSHGADLKLEPDFKGRELVAFVKKFLDSLVS